jgi:hypothetical protein
MFAELGITEVLDPAPQQDPARRMVPAGPAVKAMVLNGLGFLNHQLSLVPPFFQNKPIARLIAPGIQASPLHDAPLGRTLETLYDSGVPALYSLIAAPAAKRLALPPPAPISLIRVSMSMAVRTALRPLTTRAYTSPKVLVGIIAPPSPT